MHRISRHFAPSTLLVKNRLLAFHDLARRHPGVTPAISATYCEAATVCFDRHHVAPMSLTLERTTVHLVSAQWLAPDDRVKRAWASAIDTTYFAVDQLAMRGEASKPSPGRALRLAAAGPSPATDVMAIPAKKGRPLKAREQTPRVGASTRKAVSSRSEVSASGLKGNAGRALDFLMTRLNKDTFSRVTHAEIAEGAPIPTGSVGAAVSALAKMQKIEEVER